MLTLWARGPGRKVYSDALANDVRSFVRVTGDEILVYNLLGMDTGSPPNYN